VVSVDGVRVELSEARVVVDIAVSLEALRTVRVGAEVSGRVVAVEVEEHAAVQADQVMVSLDPALPEAAVARARASLLRARSTYDLATQEHGRQRNLSGKGISSAAAFDRSESEELRSDADVAAARAALVEAETRLEKTRIRAPFGGVVSELDLEPGAYVQVGEPVARVSDLSEIEIDVGVDDRQILALELGAPARVRVDAFPGEWFEGVVAGLARTPDPVTRKYPVPVRVANADQRLLPGMLGRVRFELGDSTPTLRIPRRAVYREFEVDYLYVLDKTDAVPGQARVQRRRVVLEPVAFRPDLIDVRGGLEPGEWIAVSGLRGLRDGLLVRVREPPAPGSQL
jgi:membrane fusion protein (multidrug efflux system)